MARPTTNLTREDVRGPFAASVSGPLPDATVRLLERMPKAELHLHLDGSLRVDTALDLARSRGIDAPTSWAGMSAGLVGPPQGPDQADLLRGGEGARVPIHAASKAAPAWLPTSSGRSLPSSGVTSASTFGCAAQ